MHADRLSRCWPQGRAQDKAPLLVPVLSLAPPLSKRGTSRSPCQQEPQARGAGLCQWSLDALVLGTLREPWETGLVTTTQGQSWEDKLPPWNLAQGQHWAAPRSGEPPRILAGGQASHPHSSCHAQSSALGAGPQSQSRRLGSPAPLLSPTTVPTARPGRSASGRGALPTCPPAAASGGYTRASENVPQLPAGFQHKTWDSKSSSSRKAKRTDAPKPETLPQGLRFPGEGQQSGGSAERRVSTCGRVRPQPTGRSGCWVLWGRGELCTLCGESWVSPARYPRVILLSQGTRDIACSGLIRLE